MSDATKQQPAPKPGGVPVWPLVIEDVAGLFPRALFRDELIADMQAREALGRERYGVPLSTENGRDALTDAYQEALDLTVHLRLALKEQGENATQMLRDAYRESLKVAIRLCTLLGVRP